MLRAYLLAKAYVDSLLKREEGQDLAEYAILLFLIAVMVIFALGPLGTAIHDVFVDITESFS